MKSVLKPYLLYFVHTHGVGHRATFQILYPSLKQIFNVVAITTNDVVSNDLRKNQNLTVIQLPPKAPASSHLLKHTFSKAFEATPYAIEPANRAGALVDIIKLYKPVALYCDGLPELAIMVRAMGVPVVLVHLLGNFMSDPTQVFAYELADHVVAHFPKVLEQTNYAFSHKTFYSGYISRYTNHDTAVAAEDDNVITILMGYDNYDDKVMQNMTADTNRTFVIIGNHHNYRLGDHCKQVGRVADIAKEIRGKVVITAAGQNSVAELLSLRKLIILLPEPRPYDEQLANAVALVKNGLALRADNAYTPKEWSRAIEQVKELTPNWGFINPMSAVNITNKLQQWYV